MALQESNSNRAKGNVLVIVVAFVVGSIEIVYIFLRISMWRQIDLFSNYCYFFLSFFLSFTTISTYYYYYYFYYPYQQQFRFLFLLLLLFATRWL